MIKNDRGAGDSNSLDKWELLNFFFAVIFFFFEVQLTYSKFHPF